MADNDIIIMEEIVRGVLKTLPGYKNGKPKVMRVNEYERIRSWPVGTIRNKKGGGVEYLIFEEESHIMSPEHWPMFYIELKDKNNVKQIIENYFENNNK